MRFARITTLALALCGGSTALATAAQPLRICAAEDELPYSNRAGEGFENRLAELLGQELGKPVENVYWRDPRYFVRDLLERGACDVVLGVDAGDPRLATTKPYYRSGYAFVYRADRKLDLTDWNSSALKSVGVIGFMPGTPVETMLRSIGRYNDMFNYLQELVDFKSRRNQYVKYDPARLARDVASGRADLAVLWAPAVARYAKTQSTPLKLQLIPDTAHRADGEPVPQHYSTAIGVRNGDLPLLGQLDAALARRARDVRALLEAEGIPLLPLDPPAANQHQHQESLPKG